MRRLGWSLLMGRMKRVMIIRESGGCLMLCYRSSVFCFLSVFVLLFLV